MDNTKNWKNDPLLKGMDSKKLQFLTDMVRELEKTPKNNLMPFFLGLTAQANSQGINFNDAETELLLRVLSPRMSEQDRKQIDTMRRLSAMLAKKR